MVDLKLCPFCGWRSAQYNHKDHNGFTKYFIRCANSSCGATGPIHSDASLCVGAWNYRTDGKDEEIEPCPFCACAELVGPSTSGGIGGSPHVRCKRCNARGPTGANRVSAVSGWNRVARLVRQAARDELGAVDAKY